MNKVQQILQAAYDLLEEGEAWTQGQGTKTEDNKMKYCSIGAVSGIKKFDIAQDVGSFRIAMSYLDLVAIQEGVTSIGYNIRPAAVFNDTAEDFSEIRGMFKRAIDMAEEA